MTCKPNFLQLWLTLCPVNLYNIYVLNQISCILRKLHKAGGSHCKQGQISILDSIKHKIMGSGNIYFQERNSHTVRGVPWGRVTLSQRYEFWYMNVMPGMSLNSRLPWEYFFQRSIHTRPDIKSSANIQLVSLYSWLKPQCLLRAPVFFVYSF